MRVTYENQKYMLCTDSFITVYIVWSGSALIVLMVTMQRKLY
jgi:hypothetical protein